MATHMSIRLAWHNEGWNGHICQKPCENSYCIGQHSYPGDLIASTRDIEYEQIPVLLPAGLVLMRLARIPSESG